MRWRNALASLAAGFALTMSPGAHADPQRQALEGTWQGAQFIDGQPQCWVETYAPNGRFKSDFLSFDGRNWQRFIEEGRWTLVNSQLTTFTELVNGRPASASGEEVDRYHVARLDANALELIEQGTNVPFRATRVAPGTQLPSTCRP